ncbi:hypothetical protein G7046_g955 [Stylonectria norvegica]|nr:hypothetical protein G7046_g955 [Stylonectria norvegica]
MVLLSEELWGHIFDNFVCYLPEEQWWMYGEQVDRSPLKTLASLCLVSRKFRRIAQPVLYRTLPMTSDDQEMQQMLLARTVYANSRLSECVRAVALDGWIPWDLLSFEETEDAIHMSFRDRVTQFMSLAKILPKESWAECAPSFILPFTRQVQLIEYTTAYDPLSWETTLNEVLSASQIESTEGTDTVKDQALGNTGRENIDMAIVERTDSAGNPIPKLRNTLLPNLREVRVRTADCVDNTSGVFEIEWILLHPGLERLRLLGFDWTSEEIRKLKWPATRYNLQLLQLKECIVDDNSLLHILLQCEHLRSLSIELCDSRREGSDREDHWEVDLYRFGDILREHGTRLEELDLHTIEYKGANSTAGRLGHLHRLTSLKHLKVVKEDLASSIWHPSSDTELPALRLQDVLPRSLETLYLHYNDTFWIGDLTDQLENDDIVELITSGRFPHLRQVKRELYYEGPTSESWGQRSLKGWKVYTETKHLWKRLACSGCLRSIMVFLRDY